MLIACLQVATAHGSCWLQAICMQLYERLVSLENIKRTIALGLLTVYISRWSAQIRADLMCKDHIRRAGMERNHHQRWCRGPSPAANGRSQPQHGGGRRSFGAPPVGHPAASGKPSGRSSMAQRTTAYGRCGNRPGESTAIRCTTAALRSKMTSAIWLLLHWDQREPPWPFWDWDSDFDYEFYPPTRPRGQFQISARPPCSTSLCVCIVPHNVLGGFKGGILFPKNIKNNLI